MTPNRERVLAAIRAAPGASIQELADACGLARSPIIHHVRRLEREGHVEAVPQGRRLLVFPRGVDETEQGLLAMMRLRTARIVLEELERDPRVAWRELARRIGITPRAVRWQVQRLEDQGLILVHRRTEGHEVVLRHPLGEMPDLPAYT